MSIADNLKTIYENVPLVYGAGQRAEYDRFWDIYQQNGNRTYYWGSFASWNDEIFKPKYPLVMSTANYTFYASTITKIPEITFNGTQISSTFNGATKLQTIEKMIIPSNGSLQFSNNPFQNTPELKNIVIEGVIGQNGLSFEWSTKLSADSIISIVNALSDTTSGLTVTLSKTAVDNIDWTTTEYGSFQALTDTKNDWNIALL